MLQLISSNIVVLGLKKCFFLIRVVTLTQLSEAIYKYATVIVWQSYSYSGHFFRFRKQMVNYTYCHQNKIKTLINILYFCLCK